MMAHRRRVQNQADSRLMCGLEDVSQRIKNIGHGGVCGQILGTLGGVALLHTDLHPEGRPGRPRPARPLRLGPTPRPAGPVGDMVPSSTMDGKLNIIVVV